MEALLQVIVGVVIAAAVTWLNNRQTAKIRATELAATADERKADRVAGAAERLAARNHKAELREREVYEARLAERRRSAAKEFARLGGLLNQLEMAMTLLNESDGGTLDTVRIALSEPLAVARFNPDFEVSRCATSLTRALDDLVAASYHGAVQEPRIAAVRSGVGQLMDAMREYLGQLS